MQLLNLTPLDGLFDPHVPALTSTASTSRFATAKRTHLGGELRTSHVGAEVRARDFQIVGPAETPAIPVARGKGEKLPAEELRLKHRNLDLRRSELQRNLILRHRLQQAARRFLDDHGYLEIETPILTKPTP